MINQQIAEELKAALGGLPFIERLGGLVKTIQKKERVDQNWKLQKLPAYYDEALKEYVHMMPDQAFKGILYFEDNGSVAGETDARGLQMESKIRVVVWYNTEAAELPEAVALAIALAALPEHLSCNGLFNRGRVKIAKIPTVEENLFSRYSYEETTNQYLMKPFAAFGVDLSITYTLNVNAIRNTYL